jgi:hypothetical protein
MTMIAESCLVVISSQLVILSQSDGDFKEFRNELTSQYEQTLKDLGMLLQTVKKSETLTEARCFVNFLQSSSLMNLIKSNLE